MFRLREGGAMVRFAEREEYMGTQVISKQRSEFGSARTGFRKVLECAIADYCNRDAR